MGSVAVANLGKDGSQMYSESLPLRVDVKPSLIPRLVRPKTGNCQAVVNATIEDQDMAFTVEAVGLRPATKDAPITFYWTLMASQWEASMSYNTLNPQASIFPKTGAFLLEDVVTTGNASSISAAGDRMLLLKVGSDVLGNGGLKVLKTGKLPQGAEDSFNTTINVAAVDATGKSVKVSIPLEVFRVATMHYDGKIEIAERFAPTQVSDCIPGGDIGRNVTYSEDKSESRGAEHELPVQRLHRRQHRAHPLQPLHAGHQLQRGLRRGHQRLVELLQVQGPEHQRTGPPRGVRRLLPPDHQAPA